MEKHFDVIQRVLELKETGTEALEHVTKRLDEGHFEETFPLFLDVVQAFAIIEQSISNLPDKRIRDAVEETTEKVRQSIDVTVTAFENGEKGKVFEIIQFSLFPRYRQWAETLKDSLRPFILS